MSEGEWAIGLMTGTIIDGFIDIAAIRTDGHDILEFGPWALSPYPDTLHALISQAYDAALAWRFDGAEPGIFAEAERALTLAQADAVTEFLDAHDMSRDAVRAIGFHGQTVLHQAPENGQPGNTRQLGDGRLMADRLGIDVVYDFRTDDIRAGGHGAPISVSYHHAVLRHLGAGADTAMINIGGVANLSWADAAGQVTGFDSGPGVGPVNDWIAAHGAGEMDLEGRIAAGGRVDEDRLRTLLAHPFFSAPWPKSLDRFDFSGSLADGLSLADGAATLTAFTACTVGRALDMLPVRPDRLIICGGGRKNPTLMAELARRADVQALAAEAVGLRGDAIEAECFGYLAMRKLRNLPISFPDTTGVPHPMPGGRVATVETVS
ncbi:MAG: anhydro-N-acetylmuramic acid kinase [Sphingopyxis sp.]|uniref:anhydro-N-acetylmuramic acid kinase n=1 Tax=Sphingopyxis sp. TaxID=1908224 RepID=UPI003D80E7F4